MSLRDWQKNSWLVGHESSSEEIAALFAIVERDLASAKVAGLADDWQLSIGYNAALQAATAALAASAFVRRASSTTIGPFKVLRSQLAGQPPRLSASTAFARNAT